MNFAYDTAHDFYYLGSEEPGPGFMRSKLDNAHVIACDIETISLKEKITLGISIATSPICCFYFPLFPQPSPSTPWHLLRNPAVCKIFHNAIFDLYCTREFELDMSNIRDTNIMSRLLCYKYNRLEDLSLDYGMQIIPAQDFLQTYKAKTMLDCPKDELARKCMLDSMATFRLYQEFLPRTDLSYLLTEMQVIPILIQMSWRGIKLDHELRFQIEENLEDETDRLRKLCDSLEGFNPGSAQQCSYILAKRGAYSVFHKLPFTHSPGRRNLSSAKEILQQMDDPLAQLILEYRGNAALLSDYIIPWGREERSQTRFHMDAATGRPTSTERNLQNIPPGEIRGVFLPDTTMFTDVDFSQVELRILAHLSDDREMQYIFSLPKLNPDGSRNEEADIHQQTANAVGISRKLSKNVNFAMIYGATDQTIMETAEIRDIGRARQLRQLWGEKFPQASDWIEGIQGQTFDNPYATTLYGRRMRLDTEERGEYGPDIESMKRKNVNYRVQGTAAEILKRALIACKHLDLALTVHDEILIGSYTPEDWLRDTLEHIAPLYTPVEVKYLTRWE